MLLQPVKSSPDDYRDDGKWKAGDQVDLKRRKPSIGIWTRVFDAVGFENVGAHKCLLVFMAWLNHLLLILLHDFA